MPRTAVQARQAEHDLAAAVVGHRAADQAGVAALRARSACRARRRARTTAATSAVLPGRTTASARPRQRLRQSTSQRPRSPLGEHVGGADDVAQALEQVGHAAVAAAWRNRARTCTAQAMKSVGRQHHLEAGQPGARCRGRWSPGPRPRRRRTRPAGSSSDRCRAAAAPARRSGSSKGRALIASVPRPVGASQSSQARHSSSKAIVAASASGAGPRDRRVRCGTVGHRPYDASNDLRRRAVTAPTTVAARSLKRFQAWPWFGTAVTLAPALPRRPAGAHRRQPHLHLGDLDRPAGRR